MEKKGVNPLVTTTALVSHLERNGVDFRYSDDEDEFTSNEEASDSEPLPLPLAIGDRRGPVRPRKQSRNKILPNARVFFSFQFISIYYFIIKLNFFFF